MNIHQNLRAKIHPDTVDGRASAAHDQMIYGTGIVVAAPRGHRRRFSKHLRVFLAGTVDVATDRQVNRWAGKTLSIGRVLDQIVAFAKRKGFTADRSKRK